MTKTDEIVRRVVQARLGGKVERCHGIPHHGSYSNAAHTWGALVLLWQLFPEHWVRVSPVLLAHDVGEGWLGDIPAPTMRYVPGLRDTITGMEGMIVSDLGFDTEFGLTKEEHAAFKACDRLELYLWANEQYLMGNQYAGDCIRELETYFRQEPLPGQAFVFFERLRAVSLLPKQAGVVKDIVDKVVQAERKD